MIYDYSNIIYESISQRVHKLIDLIKILIAGHIPSVIMRPIFDLQAKTLIFFVSFTLSLQFIH